MARSLHSEASRGVRHPNGCARGGWTIAEDILQSSLPTRRKSTTTNTFTLRIVAQTQAPQATPDQAWYTVGGPDPYAKSARHAASQG